MNVLVRTTSPAPDAFTPPPPRDRLSRTVRHSRTVDGAVTRMPPPPLDRRPLRTVRPRTVEVALISSPPVTPPPSITVAPGVGSAATSWSSALTTRSPGQVPGHTTTVSPSTAAESARSTPVYPTPPSSAANPPTAQLARLAASGPTAHGRARDSGADVVHTCGSNGTPVSPELPEPPPEGTGTAATPVSFTGGVVPESRDLVSVVTRLTHPTPRTGTQRRSRMQPPLHIVPDRHGLAQRSLGTAADHPATWPAGGPG